MKMVIVLRGLVGILELVRYGVNVACSRINGR